jgi:acetyl esterase/lipase
MFRASIFYWLPLALALLCVSQLSYAETIRERIAERRLLQQAQKLDEVEAADSEVLPAGVRVMRDVPYGKDALQRMDIYLPAQATTAPVILMVHGGAWRVGDKAASSVVQNKVARWVARGFILISANYRMLPKAAPLEQAQDVARALAAAQNSALSWGGDPARFILMGHSAGAHLVALLAASPDIAFKLGAKPWLGTVALDSAAFDMVPIMQTRHARFYDQAFGSDLAYWKAASPYQVLSVNAAPILAVCSVRRSDSCQQAKRFVEKAVSLKLRAQVLRQDLSHMEINQQLGVAGAYTREVEDFMGTLDKGVQGLLAQDASSTRHY